MQFETVRLRQRFAVGIYGQRSGGRRDLHPAERCGFDPLVEDVGDRMPQVDARRVDQSDVRRDILAAVARPAQPEFEFVERAENIDAAAERDRSPAR